MTHGTCGTCGVVILAHSTNRTSGPNENLIYVILRDNPVCLIFFSSSSRRQSRAHASGALASFGFIRRRKIMQKRIAASQK